MAELQSTMGAKASVSTRLWDVNFPRGTSVPSDASYRLMK